VTKTSEAKTLWIDAANCRTLAERIGNAQGRRKLEAMEADYDLQAATLEAESPLPS
jgi:hypothetical protein